MALARMWCAAKSAAMAMDWSMRVKVRSRKAASRVCERSARSASAQAAAMAVTVSTGYLPVAVSADSITASVPSSTALATSEISARVGTGASIIDSIICVAVMATLFRLLAMRIMRFCSAGTAASPTSTARSPRATMMPSDDFRISSRLPMAS